MCRVSRRTLATEVRLASIVVQVLHFAVVSQRPPALGPTEVCVVEEHFIKLH